MQLYLPHCSLHRGETERKKLLLDTKPLVSLGECGVFKLSIYSVADDTGNDHLHLISE